MSSSGERTKRESNLRQNVIFGVVATLLAAILGANGAHPALVIPIGIFGFYHLLVAAIIQGIGEARE